MGKPFLIQQLTLDEVNGVLKRIQAVQNVSSAPQPVTVGGTSLSLSPGITPSATSGVTSVGLVMPAQFTVSNSPVTASGNLTAAWINQAANTFLAGPSSGPSAAPTFRAMTTADLPTLTTPIYSDNSTAYSTTGFFWEQPQILTKIQVADANYTITGTHGFDIAFTSLTAPRSAFLPPATQSGQFVRIFDESGQCSGVNTITAVANGTDHIENLVFARVNFPYGAALLQSNGSGTWNVLSTNVINYSAGCIKVPTFTDLGTGSFTIGSDGAFSFFTNSDGSGRAKAYLITGGTFTPAMNTLSYLVGDYNGGSPIMYITTNVNIINETTVIPIYTLYMEGTTMHRIDWDELGLALSNKLNQSIVKTQRFRLQSGLALGEVATRTVTISAGIAWVAAVQVSMAAFSSATNLMLFYYHSAGVWTTSTVTQYNNTQYDDGTNLQSLSTNRYAVNFVYRLLNAVDDEAYILLGGGNYTLNQALASQPPANLPPQIVAMGVLVGRIIVQNGATSATEIDSAFSTIFTPSGSIDHNSLSGLQGGTGGEYYHLTNANYTQLTNIANVANSAGYLYNNGSGTFSYVGTTGTGNVVQAISPALTGTPTAPTATLGTNTTQLATCAFVLANVSSATWGSITGTAAQGAPSSWTGTSTFAGAILGTSATFSAVGVNGNNYPLYWTAPSSATGYLYTNGSGVGITNSNPNTSGSLVFLAGGTGYLYGGSTATLTWQSSLITAYVPITGTSATFSGNVQVTTGHSFSCDTLTNYGSTFILNAAGGFSFGIQLNGSTILSIAGGTTTTTFAGPIIGTIATFSGNLVATSFAPTADVNQQGELSLSASGGLYLRGKTGTIYDFGIQNAAGNTWILGNPTGTNNIILPNSTASTSTTTGALVVTGGVGIGGSLYVGGVNASSIISNSSLFAASTLQLSTSGVLIQTSSVADGSNTYSNSMLFGSAFILLMNSSNMCMQINNAIAAPTANPASGGGWLYSLGGALYWRGGSGTVTKIANA